MSYPLLTPRLSIEPLALRDVDEFVRYRQDPEIARYQSWDMNYSAQQGLHLVQSQADVVLPAPGNWLQLAIHDRETGELLGDLALHTIDTAELSFEIGFTLATKNQGNGIAAKPLADFSISCSTKWGRSGFARAATVAIHRQSRYFWRLALKIVRPKAGPRSSKVNQLS